MAESNSITLDDDQRRAIISALLVGLDSYGEIERLADAAKLLHMCGEPVPEKMRPIDTSGCSDTASQFAAALRYLHV